MAIPKSACKSCWCSWSSCLRAGEEVKMSKRTGEFITMREVIDEVGADAAKFYFLMRDSKTHLEFDLELAKQRSADNPVYYVQYAHARHCESLAGRRLARHRLPAAEPDGSLTVVRSGRVRVDPETGRLSVDARRRCRGYEPHRMTYYLQQLAALLHTFYNKHRILPPAADPRSSTAATATSLPTKGPNGKR